MIHRRLFTFSGFGEALDEREPWDNSLGMT